MSAREERADRILDAASELLLRMGSRKVTIEDIAKQAGIGKGTVYLHWRTKEQLFQALLMRASIVLVREMLTELEKDPEEIVPHRFVPMSFLVTNRHPLLLELITGELNLFNSIKYGPMARQQLLVSDDFYELMFRHGLLRKDVPDITHGLRASATGFYLFSTAVPREHDVDVETKARLLSQLIRDAYEPAEPPTHETLIAAADETRAIFRELIARYRKWVYPDDPEQPG